jgi:Flp pilus assembly CpaE family ATPase
MASPMYSSTTKFMLAPPEDKRLSSLRLIDDDADVDFEPNDTVAYEREVLPGHSVSGTINDGHEHLLADLSDLLRDDDLSDDDPGRPIDYQQFQASENSVELAPTSTLVANIDVAALDTQSERGEVITLFGCRGGAGSTTLAINLAGQLAASGQPTLLIDMDLQLGDVMVSLDIASRDHISFASAVREFSNLEGSVFVRRLVQHSSGFYVLSQNDKLEELDGSLAAQIPVLLRYLRRSFRWIVIDGVRDFSEMPLAILDSSDTISLVVTQDVAAVRRAQRVTGVFAKLGISPSRVALVLNRYARFSKIRVAEVERALAMSVTSKVRNDYSATSKSLNSGMLLTSAARLKGVTRDIRNFAEKTKRARQEMGGDKP